MESSEFQKFINSLNETNNKLKALEILKEKIMFAEIDLKKIYKKGNMPDSIKELLTAYNEYITEFEGFDDSE